MLQAGKMDRALVKLIKRLKTQKDGYCSQTVWIVTLPKL